MKMKMRDRSGFRGLMTLLATAVIMVVVLAGSFTLDAHAETNGKVTASAVNVRKSADANSDKVAGILKGDTFVVKSETTGADGKIWYLIVTEDGTEGYVRSDLVSVDSAVTTTTNNDVTKLNPVSGKVTGSTVNVRETASAKSDKVTSVTEGTVITIVGQATGSDNKVWYQVTFISDNNEVTGFIRSDYVDPSGNLTPYTEPVEEPTPTEPEQTDPGQTEPDTPPVEEPIVQETKDWDTVLVDEKWMLIENASGKYYGVNDLIQISKDNATKLEEAQATVKSQKVTIVVLVLVLLVLGAVVAFIVFRLKDVLMEELFGAKEEPAPVRRPDGQRRPEGQRPVSQRPTGAQAGQRPAGQRPAGAQAGQRPTGQRPAGAQTGQRPAGQRPAGTGASQRPAAGTAGQRPVSQRPVGTGAGQKPAGVEPIAPTFDMTSPKEEEIKQETSKRIESQQVEQKIVPNDAGKKAKNFMADEDEFEFEFLNWDGEDED